MATTQESPRVLGVCAGIGGLERGVKLAIPGARLVGLCERDSYAASVLLARMEDASMDPAPVFAGDLHEFPAAAFAGRVDLVCGGIPCQPYSTAGKQQRGDDERDLVDAFLGIVRVVGPRYVFVENVAAFAVDGLGRLLGGLAALGFDAEWLTVRAPDVGAPHRRERCFVLGYTDGAPAHTRPAPGGERHPTRESGGALADAEREQPDRHGGHGTESRGLAGMRCYPGRRAWPLPWPPRPSDRAAWARILADDPELAPALRDVRRVAPELSEGLVARTDRLRCLGNAVVPAQAAAALTELLARTATPAPGAASP